MASEINHPIQKTVSVDVGGVCIGGGAPVVVQSMTDTPTHDVTATANQVEALASAGAELVRITVNNERAAAAVPLIQRRLTDAGCNVPLIGDFHYNGHLLLSDNAECAETLAKYRINPGNIGRGGRASAHFAEICRIARDLGKAIRIGVNGGSLDSVLVTKKMEENARSGLGRTAEEVLNDCMVLSALESTDQALEHGLAPDRIVISCKTSRPVDLIVIYRELNRRTRQPLHLGLTEAGMGTKGLVWSASAMAVLLAEGIGDTIRVSLTPAPGAGRTEEVAAACELLQALSLRSFHPTVTACPGCGRTESRVFAELAQRVEAYLRDAMPRWRDEHPGAQRLKLAVMGCIVNGPGESKAADIGISLPGSGEDPKCPVFVDGERVTNLQGSSEEIAEAFLRIIDAYVSERFPGGDS